MPNLNPPSDIVAIDSGNKSYLFYVNPNNNLSYLESPNEKATGNYTANVIEINRADIRVSTNTQQVAAVTWNQSDNRTKEIRVYYVNTDEVLREVCKTGDGEWYEGSLGAPEKEKHYIAKGSSISATVHYYQDTKWNLRVFGTKQGNFNQFNIPQMSAFKFTFDEKDQSNDEWSPTIITNKIQRY